MASLTHRRHDEIGENEGENLIPQVAGTTDEQRIVDYHSAEESHTSSRSPHMHRLVRRLVRGRGLSSWILVGGLLFSFFLTEWYYDTRNVPGFFSLASINDKIDPSSSSSTSLKSKMISSSQKHVVGVVEQRSNTTIMEETKHNTNLYDSDTTVDIDFDLSLSQYDCGHFKCFIPSKSNQDIGYLVKLVTKKTDPPMTEMMGGWQLAQWIDEQFGDLPNGLHRHFYMDAPFIIPLNETVTKQLCKIRGRKQNNNKCKKMTHVPVQKMKKIEIDDFLWYKCKGPFYEKFNQKKMEYINNGIKIGNGIDFYKNIKESYHTLQTLFLLKPTSLNDFHALFDPNGNMYFTDLDQDNIVEIEQKDVEERTTMCLKGIDGLIDETKRILAKKQEELP